MSLISPVATAFRNPSIRKATIGLGCFVSVLVLESGILWYPLIVLLFVNPLVFVLAIILGLTLGLRWPPLRSLAVGDLAVFAGLAGYLVLLNVVAVRWFEALLFYVAISAIALGYALLLGGLVGGAWRWWRGWEMP